MHSERILPVPHSVRYKLSAGLQGSSIQFKWRERECPLSPSKKSEKDFLRGYHHEYINRNLMVDFGRRLLVDLGSVPSQQEAASRHEVDPALVKAIIMAESSYNPRAISKKGAKGLMQLMPLTAESLGVEDAFDPANNIHAGVGYFRRLLNQFDGDVELALAAYNAGSKRVRQYKGVSPFESTQRYIQKVFAYYETYKTQSYQIASNRL